MIHVRLVVPPDRVEQVLAVVDGFESTLDIVHLPGVVRDPDGDLVLVDVAREDASALIDALRPFEIEEHGSIATIEIDAAISRRAEAAERAAAGSPADAAQLAANLVCIVAAGSQPWPSSGCSSRAAPEPT